MGREPFCDGNDDTPKISSSSLLSDNDDNDGMTINFSLYLKGIREEA
jgi:hypothetical protein